jgi:ABC-type amino acid transport substrate-binding protein
MEHLVSHVLSGHVDFALISKDSFKFLSSKQVAKKLECKQITSNMITSGVIRDYIMVMRKGSSLAIDIDSTLASMIETGEYDTLRMNWMFGGKK